jgi:mycothiol synthase
LVQLRRSLPLDEASRQGIPEVHVRPFDPDRDTQGLLRTNNAAFDWHPEQGRWDPARLAEALAQPWVDPVGILVHESDDPPPGDDRIDGFCWTRIHPADDPEILAAGDPALGEIWVIATHPRVHGTRLGPAMVAAGLDHLADRGLRVANLYTEEDNEAALTMYDRFGFTIHQRRGGYR